MRSQKSILFVAMLLFAAIATAQKTEPVNIQQAPVKMVYGEIGGPGIFSVNYDQRFRGKKGWGFRAGMGGIGFLTAGIFTLPVGLNYLSGSDSHYLELGAGASFITVSDGESFFDEASSSVFGYLTIGYRYQPEKRGITARVVISPLIVSEGIFPFYGGISVGFRF